MNDRLKFRVWDNIDKRYILTGSIDIDKGRLSVNGFYEENRFFIEQCTGLKDKNGNLIFENDIVKGTFFHAFPELNFIGTIFWHNDVAGFGMNEWDLATIEVIGNIHQNSELLEKGGK